MHSEFLGTGLDQLLYLNGPPLSSIVVSTLIIHLRHSHSDRQKGKLNYLSYVSTLPRQDWPKCKCPGQKLLVELYGQLSLTPVYAGIRQLHFHLLLPRGECYLNAAATTMESLFRHMLKHWLIHCIPTLRTGEEIGKSQAENPMQCIVQNSHSQWLCYPREGLKINNPLKAATQSLQPGKLFDAPRDSG